MENNNEIIQPVKNTYSRKSNFLIGLLIFIIITLSAFIVVLWANNYSLNNLFSKKNGGIPVSDTTPVPDNTINPNEDSKNMDDTKLPDEDSTNEITDKTWTTYQNNKLGFSIKVPINAVNPYGACDWKTDGEQPSYRPRPDFVPIVVFEKPNGVHIAYEYSYELDDSVSTDGHTYFNTCRKVNETLTSLDKQRRTWSIIVIDVDNDTEIDAFIKQRFGSACSILEKNESEQEGVYDVRIKGDGKDMPESDCVVNYMYVLKYAPAVNKLYTFDRGQSFAFAGSIDYSVVYDDEMEDSFTVLLPK